MKRALRVKFVLVSVLDYLLLSLTSYANYGTLIIRKTLSGNEIAAECISLAKAPY
jgi:hypothetical protein